MTEKHLVRSGRVVDPSQDLDDVRDVLLDGGRVAQIAAAGSLDAEALGLSDEQVTEAEGLVVTPGLIDARVQFGEPGYEHRETLRSGLWAASRGGFTSVVHWGWSDPEPDNRAVIETLRAGAAAAGGARLHTTGALTRGRRGESLAELGELADAGCVAFGDGGRPLTNAALLRRALIYSRHFGQPVACRATDPNLVDGAVMHEGAWSTRLGLPGVPAVAEESIVARDLLLVDETGGRYHLAPATLAGSLERVRAAKAAGLAVTCDVPVTHLVLADGAVAETGFSPALRLEPPLRSAGHLEALHQALVDGTIDAIVSDHRPYHDDEKDVQFSVAPPGCSGLETLVSVCLDRLVRPGVIDLARLVDLLSCRPAAVFGLDAPERGGLGSLRPGSAADLTLLDVEREVTVDPTRFVSRSRWTPFAGWTLHGAAVGTFVAGRRIDAAAGDDQKAD